MLIDVREAHERAGGMAEGARGVSKGELQADPAAHLPRHDQEILLICQSGKRSADAAQFLLEAGYTHVASVSGGTVAWREQSLPLVQPLASAADRDFFDRYSRHLLLPQVGEAGQRRLQQSRVLVLGAGGLGAPAGFTWRPPGWGTCVLPTTTAWSAATCTARSCTLKPASASSRSIRRASGCWR